MGFRSTGADLRPTLVCVGTVGSIKDAVASKTPGSPYYVQEIEIKPSGKGQKAKLRLMYDPAWFCAGFGMLAAGAELPPDDKRHAKAAEANLKAWCQEHGKQDEDTGDVKPASSFIFQKHIGGKGESEPPFLAGLCTNLEAWEALGDALTAKEEPLSADEGSALIQEALRDQAGQPFLYVLEQQRKDGVRSDFYDVKQVLQLTATNLKRLIKEAVRVQEAIDNPDPKKRKDWSPYRFKFDPSDYGFTDIELPTVPGEPAWVTA